MGKPETRSPVRESKLPAGVECEGEMSLVALGDKVASHQPTVDGINSTQCLTHPHVAGYAVDYCEADTLGVDSTENYLKPILLSATTTCCNESKQRDEVDK